MSTPELCKTCGHILGAHILGACHFPGCDCRGKAPEDSTPAIPNPGDKNEPDVSLCRECWCMTHDILSDTKGDETYCGKCGKLKPTPEDSTVVEGKPVDIEPDIVKSDATDTTPEPDDLERALMEPLAQLIARAEDKDGRQAYDDFFAAVRAIIAEEWQELAARFKEIGHGPGTEAERLHLLRAEFDRILFDGPDVCAHFDPGDSDAAGCDCGSLFVAGRGWYRP